MIAIRKASERGHFDHGWLNTNHTFSFGSYWDPKQMGFRSLRVINEDWIEGGQGFGMHPHKDMEIITYVLEGAVAHKDTTGGEGVLRPGEVQTMTAGKGLLHSEFNASKTETLHLYQIWLIPEKNGLKPAYAQKEFPYEEREGKLRPIASRDGRDGSLVINQDATLYSSVLNDGEEVKLDLTPGRHAWIQVVKGEVTANGKSLMAGDGAAMSEEAALVLTAKSESEVLLFDLA